MIKSLDIDITDHCNFNCKYCYKKEKHEAKQINMLSEVKKEIIKLCKKKNDLVISFFGGEPLLCINDIIEIVSSASFRKWQIVSNLSLLDDEKTRLIKKYKGSVHSSIDGCRKAHDLFRVSNKGNGTFDTLIHGAKNALKLNKNGTARGTLLPQTIDFMYESVIELIKLGYKKIALMPVLEENWTNEDWDKYKEQLDNIALFKKNNNHIYIKNLNDCVRKVRSESNKRYRRCGAGFNTLSITTYGYIYPCHRFNTNDIDKNKEQWCFGNVLTGINKNKIKKYQEQFDSFPDGCSSCIAFNSCTLGCPYVVYNLNTDKKETLNKTIKNHCMYMKIGTEIVSKYNLDRRSNVKLLQEG